MGRPRKTFVADPDPARAARRAAIRHKACGSLPTTVYPPPRFTSYCGVCQTVYSSADPEYVRPSRTVVVTVTCSRCPSTFERIGSNDGHKRCPACRLRACSECGKPYTPPIGASGDVLDMHARCRGGDLCRFGCGEEVDEPGGACAACVVTPPPCSTAGCANPRAGYRNSAKCVDHHGARNRPYCRYGCRRIADAPGGVCSTCAVTPPPCIRDGCDQPRAGYSKSAICQDHERERQLIWRRRRGSDRPCMYPGCVRKQVYGWGRTCEEHADVPRKCRVCGKRVPPHFSGWQCPACVNFVAKRCAESSCGREFQGRPQTKYCPRCTAYEQRICADCLDIFKVSRSTSENARRTTCGCQNEHGESVCLECGGPRSGHSRWCADCVTVRERTCATCPTTFVGAGTRCTSCIAREYRTYCADADAAAIAAGDAVAVVEPVAEPIALFALDGTTGGDGWCIECGEPYGRGPGRPSQFCGPCRAAGVPRRYHKQRRREAKRRRVDLSGAVDLRPLRPDQLDAIRDDGCVYCGDDFEHLEHVRPIVAGGFDHVANLVGSCAACNLDKHALLLTEWDDDRIDYALTTSAAWKIRLELRRLDDPRGL